MTRNSFKRLFTLSLILGMIALLGGQPMTVDAQSGNPNAYGSDASAPNNTVFVTSAGNVGVGTTAPARRLEIVTDTGGATNHLISFLTSADGGKGSIFGVDTTNRYMYWRMNDSGDYGWQFQNNQGAPVFQIYKNGQLSVHQDIELDFNHAIGVSGVGAFSFPYAGHTMGGLALGFFKPNNTGRGQMWLSGQDGMVFFTNGDGEHPRMAITADGKVGIGNPNPTHALQVNGPSVYFTGDLNLDGALQFPSNAKLSSDNGMVRFFTQGSQRMVLTPPGNLDLEYNMRIGPSADDGFGFDYSGKRMTGNALMWARDPAAGARAEMWLSGNNGMTFFTAQQPRMGIVADGTVGIYGDFGVDGHTTINSLTTKSNVSINGTTSTKVLQITGGSDLAEPFVVSSLETVEPGTVVVLDPANPGQLRVADGKYDTLVAGIVSGAGGINPGLIMQQESVTSDGVMHPVALTGKVYVKAVGPIKVGDLLTTSDVPGHAMAATDRERAFGATLGKAMSPLEKGTGLVLVLVTLQ